MKRSYSANSSHAVNDLCSKVTLVERTENPSGYTLVNPKAIAKKAPDDLVELALEIQKANNFVTANATNKLQMIAQQVRFLQRQAEDVLNEAKRNMTLHQAACNFVKVPGNVYHLYKKPSGQEYFGMLSPAEWCNCPHEYIGSFRLEYDQSWTSIEHIQEKDNELQIINKILDINQQKFVPQALLNVNSTPMDL